uniref:Ig-like domain-containing protein n=1 Tax=Sinocyclocheilus anshuiensis TaxID=1608454 RepID=A0A671SEV8_9TELE
GQVFIYEGLFCLPQYCVLLYDALGWEVRMPRDIHSLKGSCLVIPCSFNYKSNPPKNPRRVVWYQWDSKGLPLVYDPLLLGNPDEQNCTVEMDDVQTHDNRPFCFRAERENERYSFNNSCVFIIMQAPDKPVMSSLPEDIEPGTRVAFKCSVNHTSRETISHNHMGGGVWETVSALTFIPTGYEEKGEIVCTAKFWGGKTQNNTSFLSIRSKYRLMLMRLACAFVCFYILIIDCRQPRHDMQGSHTQSEQRYVHCKK